MCAATIAPVSSKLHSFSVIAARTTADCHSNGTARWRTKLSQWSRVRSRNSLPVASIALRNGSSWPKIRVIGWVSANVDFLADVGERAVGGEAHDFVAADIADVVGADDEFLDWLPVVVRRPHADGDARQARDRLDAADDLRRTEGALVAVEARREVGDAHRGAARVGQHRLDDRGVAHIARRAAGEFRQHDVAKALLLVARQQPREHRVGIEARKAPPDDARAAVDERGDAAISDQRQIKALFARLSGRPQSALLAFAKAVSQARTPSGPRRRRSPRVASGPLHRPGRLARRRRRSRLRRSCRRRRIWGRGRGKARFP